MLDQMSKGRVEVGIGRGVYGREAINMNKEADLKTKQKILDYLKKHCR